MGSFDLSKKKQLSTAYTISYNEGRFKNLSPKYKYLCSLGKENAKNISKIVNYGITTRYEDSYSIYIDSENGNLIFAHKTLVCIGAASTDNTEYATVIQYDTLKKLLSYEMDYYNSLVKKWENENDFERADLCKEHLQMLKKIIDIYPVTWNALLDM